MAAQVFPQISLKFHPSLFTDGPMNEVIFELMLIGKKKRTLNDTNNRDSKKYYIYAHIGQKKQRYKEL